MFLPDHFLLSRGLDICETVNKLFIHILHPSKILYQVIDLISLPLHG